MNVFRAELARFWYRPMSRWTTVGLVALIALGATLGFVQSKPTGFTTEEQRALVDKMLRCNPEFFVDTADNDNDADGNPVGQEPQQTPTGDCPTPSEFEQEFWATNILGPSHVLDWSTEFSETPPRETLATPSGEHVTRPLPYAHNGIVTSEGGIVLLLVAIALGGSYIGADFRTGVLEQLLVWDSRRIRVLLTKSVSTALSMSALAAGLSVFLSASWLAVARFRGTFVGVDNEFWVDLATGIGRVSTMAGAFAILSIAVATISKHTVGAVVSLLSLSILSPLIGVFFPSLARWELFKNGSAFITRADVSTNIEVDTVAYYSFSHSYLAAGLVVAAWVAVALAVATVVFSRRDIT